MSVEYARKGLIGVFTPQANTTVEPEMAILTPPGYAFINARMTSDKATINARLLDYMDQFPDALRRFANAPLNAVALACTGSSYLIGPEREDALLAAITAASGAPALTGASASVDALRTLGARKIGLVTPYNSELDRESAGFWTARGFEVVAEASCYRDSADFHPIYSLSAAAAETALKSLAGERLDAILLLGTGMPTLEAIARWPHAGGAPVLSCMLCVAWGAVAAIDAAEANKPALERWIAAEHWREALSRALGRTVERMA